MHSRLFLATMLAAGGCFPDFPDDQRAGFYSCDNDAQCAAGFLCQQGTCVTVGAQSAGDSEPDDGGDPGGDHHRTRHDLAEVVVADVDVGRVQIDVGELDMAQRAVAERGDAFVETGKEAT